MTIPITWFLLRATGIVALLLLTFDVALGLVGPRLKPTARLTTISMHVAAGITGTVLLVGHVVFAVVDQYIHIPWEAVFIPGLSSWNTWWIALGAVSLDLLILIMASAMLRGRSPDLWRRLHLLSYPMWALAWGHALTAGTDSTVMAALAFISGGAVGLALILRLTGKSRPVGPDVLAKPRTLAGEAPKKAPIRLTAGSNR